MTELKATKQTEQMPVKKMLQNKYEIRKTMQAEFNVVREKFNEKKRLLEINYEKS